MRVVSLVPGQDQRQRLSCALALTGSAFEIREIASPEELEHGLDWQLADLVLVEDEDAERHCAHIGALRSRMPRSTIVAVGKIGAHDFDTVPRLRQAGADVVVDIRFSLQKIALIIQSLRRARA